MKRQLGGHALIGCETQFPCLYGEEEGVFSWNKRDNPKGNEVAYANAL